MIDHSPYISYWTITQADYLSQYRELTIMREIWVDYFKYENQYNSSDEDINKYSMYLTIAFKNISG
jgi:hypothetical protein